jgi:hypothetical protein
LSQINSIKISDFATLYTTLPQDELKITHSDIVDSSLLNKKRKKETFISRDQLSGKNNFVKYCSDSTYKMMAFPIDNILVVGAGLPTVYLNFNGYELCFFVS